MFCTCNWLNTRAYRLFKTTYITALWLFPTTPKRSTPPHEIRRTSLAWGASDCRLRGVPACQRAGTSCRPLAARSVRRRVCREASQESGRRWRARYSTRHSPDGTPLASIAPHHQPTLLVCLLGFGGALFGFGPIGRRRGADGGEIVGAAIAVDKDGARLL